MKKIIIVIGVVLTLIGLGYRKWGGGSSPKKEVQLPETVKVERGFIRLGVVSSGKVISNLDVDIKCKASGEVIKLPFDVSDMVKKGNLLLELDPVDEQRLVRQAHSQLSASQARLINAQENMAIAEQNLITERQRAASNIKSVEVRANDSRMKADRVKELLTKKLSSQEEYETASTASAQAAADLEAAKIRLEELKTQARAIELTRQQVLMAESQVENDKIALDIAEQRLADTKVVAPINGVVTSRLVQIGQIISSGISNVGGGTTAMTLSDLSHIFVLASVDESDIGKVFLEQAAKITVDAFPGKKFEGKVVRIATRGVNVSNVVTFEVKMEVISSDKNLLRPEMTANVDITAVEKNNVLLVPMDSILRKEGKSFVTLWKEGNIKEEKLVEVGFSDGQKLEILGGINEGEAVIVRKNTAESKWKPDQPRPNPARMMGGR